MAIKLGLGLGISRGGGGAALLPAPTFPSATPSLGSNMVTWTDPAGITDQNLAVYYSDVGASGPWILLNDGIAAGSQTYTDDGTDDPDHLPYDSIRHYKIRALASSDAPASAAVTCSCLSYPSAPTLNSVANLQGDGSLVLSIALPAGTADNDLVQVYYAGVGPIGYYYLAASSITVPYSDVSGYVGTLLPLAVTIINNSGEGNQSSGVSVLVTYPTPNPPTVSDDGGGGNEINWSPSDPAFAGGSVAVFVGPTAGSGEASQIGGVISASSGGYDDQPPTISQGYYVIAASDGAAATLSPPSSPGVQGPN